MRKEDLIELGIEDEGVQAELFKLHGKTIESLKGENEELTGKVEDLTGKLENASQTIESFTEQEKDLETIQQEAEEWKTKAEEAEELRQQEIQELKFSHAVDEQLKAAGARNLKAAKALLDMDSIEFDEEGEGLVGLGDQLEAITLENEFLFDSGEPEPKIVTGSQKKNVLGDPAIKAAREAAGIDGKG